MSDAIILPESLSPALRERLEGLFAKLEGVSPDSQDYEFNVRTTLAQGNPISAEEADELLAETIRMCHRTDVDDNVLLPCFCGAFEWFNRCEKDIERRNAKWDTLLRAINKRYEGVSIYHYICSRYYLGKRNPAEALSHASAAVDIAPDHAGYLNNYGEMVLDQAESRLLAGDRTVLTQENSRGEDIVRIIQRIDDVLAGGAKVYPSFYLTRGRLSACLGRFEEAQRNFTDARALIVKMREAGDPRFANESDYIIEIGKVINAQTTLSVLRSSFTAWESLDAARAEQDRKSEELMKKMEEVNQRLDDERVNLLEFLGFFSGIISFIIASIQVGGDMDFTARASLLIVMLGTLLIAFGALGYLIENARTNRAETKGTMRMATTVAAKSRALLFVGIGCVIFAFLVYIVFSFMGVS